MISRQISRARRLLPEPAKRPIRVFLRGARGLRTGVLELRDRILPGPPEVEVEGVSERILEHQSAAQREGRHFGQGDLERLERLLASADAVLPLGEAFARRADHPERFLALRHDMDHDVENAVALARWEAERGFRSTYFVLHGDWYWGKAGPANPSAYVLRALDQIAELGHEIGVHNNALAESLRTGRPPAEVLGGVLDGLRRHGFSVTGTAAHGDPLARRHGFLNFELFAECPHPDGKPATRTIEALDPASHRMSRLALEPLPMASLGLEYEAYHIGHTRYLSEAEGRWSDPPEQVATDFRREGGYLQVLTHPVHWALGDEVVRPLPARTRPPAVGVDPTVADPAAPPFPILVRGDCCSRRAINMNRDLFGGNPLMIRDEKSRADFHLEHARYGSPGEDDIRRLMDLERLTGSHRDYALSQTSRDTLQVEAARLIVIDSYADMNFTAWRNREHGWKLWVYADFLRDREAFERDFERAGYQTLDEAIDHNVQLIELYRSRVGEIPVLFMSQPTAFYRKLDHRLDFRALAPEVARRLPGVFVADVDDGELEPDDVGSSGPGQTLHFSGPTYRKMLQVALEQGLEAWLTRPSISTPA